MNISTKFIENKIAHLTDDAESLIHVARDSASKQAEEISRHLTEGSARSKELYHLISAKGVEKTQAINQELHTHPLQYSVIIAGLGLIVGFVLGSRCRYSRS